MPKASALGMFLCVTLTEIPLVAYLAPLVANNIKVASVHVIV